MNKPNGHRIALAVAACYLTAALTTSGDAKQEGSPLTANFHVATNGNDQWSGRLAQPNEAGTDGPFATLSHARDAVRRLKKDSTRKDIVVLIRGGTYRLDQTLVFSLEDSAPDGGTITYAAYPGEKPVLSSGVPIGGWRKLDADPAALPAVAWGEVWVADVPKELDRVLTLYDAAGRLPRARGEGFTAKSFTVSKKEDSRTRMEMLESFVQNWPDVTNGELLVVPSCDYEMSILPVKSVDAKKNIIETTLPASRPMGKVKYMNKTAWIENVMEVLNQEGEWVFSAAERKIYLWPRGGKPQDVVAPKLTELLRVEGKIDMDGPADTPVRGLTFRGLTFSHAERLPWHGNTGLGLQHHWEMFDRPSAAVRFRGAEDCAIQACRVVDTSGTGVRLDLHCQRNRIVDNEVSRVGGVGILLCGYGPGTKDVNKGNDVSNNWVHHIGEIYWASPAIMVWQSGENHVANNLIHNTPYSAITVTGRVSIYRLAPGEEVPFDGSCLTVRWKEVGELPTDRDGDISWYNRERFLHGRKNKVEHNDIHHIMEFMGDGNGIYISGTGKDNHIYQNYIHDMDGDGTAAGIRCDNDQWETIMEGNIVYNVRAVQTGICTTEMNHMINNVIVNLIPSRRPIARQKLVLGYIGLPDMPIPGAKIQRNIVYSTRKGYLPVIVHRSMAEGPGEHIKDMRADRNLYWCNQDPQWGQRYLDGQRPQGVERDSVCADPMFVDVAKGDLRLKPESPAWKLGFEAIDMSKIGLLPGHPYYRR